MEFLIILFLIFLNGLFAMSEIAVVSARRPRLQQWSKRGDPRARAALELHDSPNTFLSTIQIGITLIGVTAGAIGEAVIAGDVAAWLRRSPLVAPYSDALAFALVVIVITYLSLIVGELVPKRLALMRPERVARAIALPMQTLSRLAHPAVRLLSVSMDALLRLLGTAGPPEPRVTEEEIRTMIEEGTQSGVFLQSERDIIKNAIRLADRTMGMLMVPRSEMTWLDLEDPAAENQHKITTSPHSRFPVTRGGLENVLGIVQAKDLLARVLAGHAPELEPVLRPVLHVPETMSPLRLLDVFKSSPDNIALVVDEYGEIKGLVTLNDIVQAIIGELPLAGEVVEPQIVRREDGSWLLDGMLSIDEFKDAFNLTRLPDEETGYETIGGFVLAQIGRVPAIADAFEWNGLRFEVVDMDGNRIDRILVAPAADRQHDG